VSGDRLRFGIAGQSQPVRFDHRESRALSIRGPNLLRAVIVGGVWDQFARRLEERRDGD